MRPIVVPVNFTANSSNAARYAADLALAIGADIHLLYAFQIPISISEVPLPQPVFEELRESGLEQLEDLRNELTKHTSGKIAVTTEMDTGSIEQRLKEFCKVKHPFLVVTGTPRHLSCPQLVVPEGSQFHPIGKIVIACDREDIDGGIPAALPLLKELSELLGAALEVVHVINEHESDILSAMNEYNTWKKDIKALGPEIHFIQRPRVEEGIRSFLRHHSADWLIVFPKSHSFLEFHHSQSRYIAQDSVIPVMSIHE